MKSLVIACALAAIACRSPSSRYYTLVQPPSESTSPPSDLQLDVLPVDVPAGVDRAEIVVRDGPGEVTPVETRSWIAPLPAEIRRALSDGLTRVLGARDIAGLTPADGSPVVRVKLSVHRFESELGKRAMIEAVSTVRLADGGAPLVCAVRASEAPRAGYDGLAEAHQRALSEIATQVATAVRSMRAGSPHCADDKSRSAAQ